MMYRFNGLVSGMVGSVIGAIVGARIGKARQRKTFYYKKNQVGKGLFIGLAVASQLVPCWVEKMWDVCQTPVQKQLEN